MSAAIVWFRRDLRLNDNPALAAAAEADRIVPLFCFQRGLWAGRHASPNRNAYLLASLRELGENLRRAGSNLYYRAGDPATEIVAVAEECGAGAVHVNRDHTAHAHERDVAVYEALADREIELIGHTGISCAEVATIQTNEGTPYKVFTPFYRSWARAPRRDLAKRPRKLRSPSALAVGKPPSEAQMGIDARAKRLADAFWPGEEASRRRMRDAVGGCDDYEEIRNDAGADRTTKLSPALHFGTVSARELESLLVERGSEGATELRRQLAWRDFWMNVIRQAPSNRAEEFDPDLRGMRWRCSEGDLDAWKRGRTGVPWIDAGMRQLLDEGWMHNRVRMAVASFLTKNLLIDWREGEAHFMRHLLDGDEAQNNGNWQWSASTGADPQPYFRIFNPVRQQERFDPNGTYVRRWVPELRELGDQHLAAPWETPAEIAEQADCVIGRDYPAPLVDLGDSRAEALERFKAQSG